MEYNLAIIAICAVIITIIFIIIGTTLAAKSDVKQYNYLVAQKQRQLHQLELQIANQTPNGVDGLTATQTQALDEYERSNIKLPVEIIEDLQYQRIYEYADIIDFIENQRHFWKLENSKKLYKRKV